MRLIAFPRAGLTPSGLRFLKQLGVNDVRLGASWVPGHDTDGHLNLDGLRRILGLLGEHGLRLGSIYLEKLDTAKLLLDQPGWEVELDNVCRTIEAMGQAGVPVLEYSHLASRVIRDSTGQPIPGYWINPHGRGGAHGQSFDEARALTVTERPAGLVSADQMWERIARFQQRCVSVATEAKVHLACHPDDPPVENHWGVDQVLNSIEGIDRLLALEPSDYNGLLLCTGTLQAAGIDVIAAIHRYGSRRKIFDVDMRNVRGQVPQYDEVFLDEGDLDTPGVIQALREIDYQWTMEPDHVPQIDGDGPEGLASYAWALGYIKGLIDAS